MAVVVAIEVVIANILLAVVLYYSNGDGSNVGKRRGMSGRGHNPSWNGGYTKCG